MRLLVAAQPLQAGTLLKDTDLREREVPMAEMPDGAFVVNEDLRAEIRGAMLRRYLDAGGVVLRPMSCGRVTAASWPRVLHAGQPGRLDWRRCQDRAAA